MLGGHSPARRCVRPRNNPRLPERFWAPRAPWEGYEARTRLVRALKAPDFLIALIEDAVGGGFLLVSVLR